jgi:hypothetical protein
MALKPGAPSPVDPADLDEECAIWDWARTAGVSASELRAVLHELLVLPRGDRQLSV